MKAAHRRRELHYRNLAIDVPPRSGPPSIVHYELRSNAKKPFLAISSTLCQKQMFQTSCRNHKSGSVKKKIGRGNKSWNIWTSKSGARVIDADCDSMTSPRTVVTRCFLFLSSGCRTADRREKLLAPRKEEKNSRAEPRRIVLYFTRWLATARTGVREARTLVRQEGGLRRRRAAAGEAIAIAQSSVASVAPLHILLRFLDLEIYIIGKI